MKVKNEKASSDTWCGQEIAAGAEYTLQSSEISTWQDSDKVMTDLSSGDLTISDGVSWKAAGSEAIQFLLGIDSNPKDTTGRPINRLAATIEGFHYQLLSVEVTTADKDGFWCKDEDGSDVGFVTHKIYDDNDDEITDAANEGNAVKTVIWIRPTHAYEVIGAIFGQSAPPSTDIRLFATGLPDIANVRFARGGINLKHAGEGTYQLTDGRASKYLSYNAGVPDLNAFKFTLLHGLGVQHTFQISMEIFKAP